MELNSYPVGSVLIPHTVRVDLNSWTPSWCQRIRELVVGMGENATHLLSEENTM